MSKGFWDDAEVISSYSRAQAIEDGQLVDLSELAKEAGFKWPLAVSRGVWGILAPWDDGSPGELDKPKEGQPLYGHGQSFQGRAWDMLQILLWEIRKGKGGNRVDFAPLFLMPGGSKARGVEMWSHVGPGDTPEPVITVMLEGED